MVTAREIIPETAIHHTAGLSERQTPAQSPDGYTRGLVGAGSLWVARTVKSKSSTGRSGVVGAGVVVGGVGNERACNEQELA